jgi:hypothetical protein
MKNGGVRYVLVADRRFWGGKKVAVAVRAQATLFVRAGTSLGEEDGGVTSRTRR